MSSFPRKHQYVPVGRRRLPWDHFFEEGDIKCLSRSKQVSLPVQDVTKQRTHFACHIKECSADFASLAEFEMHYNAVHWNVCSHCKQNFPSNHLLDVHVQERHDSFFEVMKLKENMYQCLIASCVSKFMTEEDRHSHLIQVHHYPPDFQFDKPSNKKSGATCGTGQSELTPEHDDASVLQERQLRKFPKDICFGQDSTKSFQFTDQTDLMDYSF